ncbi:hypothetical protein DSO57_1003938 [Entomophthora muscae]|uniref:Uncharacterized protein n=2 Tax=Entomophthora muscae TaxID=34485 RepID=A0ACC2RZA1_9FUNG|nr:hypothetical protein DSO57_1016374 [Entomophthora muscae]KAJ9055441.1 hypothetical protein DSO57_1003938 [Entomophthora muscae]
MEQIKLPGIYSLFPELRRGSTAPIQPPPMEWTSSVNLSQPGQVTYFPIIGRRTRISPQQLKILNCIFEEKKFPDAHEREILAQQLNISPRTIQIWFQNRRQKSRSGRHCRSSSN